MYALTSHAPTLSICISKYQKLALNRLAHAPADKQVFPKLDTVGWYSTGSSVGQHDMQVHKLVGAWSSH